MPLPAVLTVNNWKNQGLTLRTTLDKIKKLSTGISDALRDLSAAYNLPAWETAPKHQAYADTNASITATLNAHANNAALTTLLNNMRNALPHVKQDWIAAINGLTLNTALGTPAFYNVLHTWAAAHAFEESLEFLKAKHDNVAIPALFTTYIGHGAPKLLNVDDDLIQALTAAPGHNAPAAWQKVQGDVNAMVLGRWAEFLQSLKNAL